MSRRRILENSVSYFRQKTIDTINFNFETPDRYLLASIREQADLDQFVTGSDADVGGQSTVNLDIGPHGRGRLWGKLSTELRPGFAKEGVIDHGGYAGFRTRLRPSLFGELTHDLDPYDYLRLRVRNSGDDMTYFVNIQTAGVVRTQIYQHRLFLGPLGDKEWQTVTIPLDDFSLTNHGSLAATQQSMMKEAVRTVGISVLGPKEGRFELGIEEIEAVKRKFRE